MKTKLTIIFALFITVLISCDNDDGSSKKAIEGLVEDVMTKAPKAETAGNFFNFLKTLKQVKGLDSTKQCEIAQNIYCSLYRSVKQQDAGLEICKAIEKGLYGGSFPPLGQKACMTVAGDKIVQLKGKEQELKKICDDLREKGCK